MKRFIITILFICVNIIIIAAQKTFDCDMLSFTYPSYFKKAIINNAPHMLLKLESDKYFFSISSWKYHIDKSVDIWDDEIYEHYKGYSPGDSKFVSIEKATIKTTIGNEHCLKIKTNSEKNDIKIKTLFYLMINNGNLFSFTFLSEGEYTPQSSTQYTDKIMQGLKFKTHNQILPDIPTTTVEELKRIYMDFCQQLNKQMPMYIDEVTTLNSVVFINWEIIYNYNVKLDFSNFNKDEIDTMLAEMKNKNKRNLKYLYERGTHHFKKEEFIELMKLLNLKFKFSYYDINNRFIGSIIYDYKDFDESL